MLNLRGTQVTNQGVKRLKQALPNCKIQRRIVPSGSILPDHNALSRRRTTDLCGIRPAQTSSFPALGKVGPDVEQQIDESRPSSSPQIIFPQSHVARVSGRRFGMIPPLPPCEGSGYTTVMNETAKSQRRWFHLTPERLLLALLPIWGVLFLAEHLRWLPKGYPVLLAVTSMVVILVLLVLWLAVALMFRRRFQYSLRSLLLVMLLASFGMSWAAVELRAVRRQKEAVDAVESWAGM